MSYTSFHDQPGAHTFTVDVAAVAAATTTGYVAVFVAPYAIRVNSLSFDACTAVTGDNTNTKNLNVDYDGTTEVANLDLATGTNLAIGENDIPISDSNGYFDMAAGETLRLEVEKVGSGVATPAGTLRIVAQGN